MYVWSLIINQKKQMLDKKILDQIDKDKYYSAKSVVDNKFVHWKSRMTFVGKLRQQKYIEIFNPIVEKAGKTNRFYIKGANIINFLMSLEKTK